MRKSYKLDHQQVRLDKGCETRALALHELMHTLGFWHEHARPDRDDYVTILWDNIHEGLLHY